MLAHRTGKRPGGRGISRPTITTSLDLPQWVGSAPAPWWRGIWRSACPELSCPGGPLRVSVRTPCSCSTRPFGERHRRRHGHARGRPCRSAGRGGGRSSLAPRPAVPTGHPAESEAGERGVTHRAPGTVFALAVRDPVVTSQDRQVAELGVARDLASTDGVLQPGEDVLALGGHATAGVEGTGPGCVGGVIFTPDPQKLRSDLSTGYKPRVLLAIVGTFTRLATCVVSSALASGFANRDRHHGGSGGF
ncbi:hypothetical protein SGPA1_80045 [Streptomyces misionensis JCM 4497]